MKLRRHFVLAALAGKRKPLPALDSVRVAGFSTDSFCPITLNSCPITRIEKGRRGLPAPF